MESEAAPYIGMLMAEFCQVGLMIISKQAMNTGMTTFVFVSYSNAIASLILLPFSLFLHRSNLPPLSFSLLGWFFLLALSGCLAQLFGYTGINYSSPTLGAAMLNLVPGLTFLLAIIFRMEMLNTRNITCLAKLVGTIVSIAGAFVVTLYEGPPLLKRLATLHTHQLSLRGDQMNWILGGFFLAIDCVMASSWVIIQAIILKKYPAELIVVFFYCFFVAIQSGIVTLIVERDLSAWSLKPTLRLLAILYSAIFGSALQVGLCSWCLRRKGPVFVCMFKPLGIAIAAIAGVVFFGDTLYLGSLLGVIIIVLGFYSVMWGKSKEEKKIHAGHFSSLGFPTQKMPLLENYAEETVNAAA
ncbi:WAT1-related protein At3g28050-like [Chenopodium quinoa]|uniref:WAT1-related protein At3g28050-like n=1 Tax=Chenopodium quinoa TaxID=63459 RepID=UPI000B794826|nr:WAT1-related protein At3g28050-like [Chenopodium quinoa]XP_021741985.1 WAT1-related protein At3g28050-like [Chenopodium quinoa]XP_021741990.1 WAT1-related protein At3g28050-like [Chenopodium quinoa]